VTALIFLPTRPVEVEAGMRRAEPEDGGPALEPIAELP
jgi:hypothetical protein